MSDHASATPETPATSSPVQLPLDAVAIRKILPHRYPFLLVDRVIELVPRQSITAIKCLSQNEPFFTGHFPSYPVFPGVLQVEALAQTGAILLLLNQEFQGKLAMLTGVEDCKFRRPVLPGDVLRMTIDDFKIKRTFGRAHGRMSVDDEMTCECTIGFGLVEWHGPALV